MCFPNAPEMWFAKCSISSWMIWKIYMIKCAHLFSGETVDRCWCCFLSLTCLMWGYSLKLWSQQIRWFHTKPARKHKSPAPCLLSSTANAFFILSVQSTRQQQYRWLSIHVLSVATGNIQPCAVVGRKKKTIMHQNRGLIWPAWAHKG